MGSTHQKRNGTERLYSWAVALGNLLILVLGSGYCWVALSSNNYKMALSYLRQEYFRCSWWECSLGGFTELPTITVWGPFGPSPLLSMPTIAAGLIALATVFPHPSLVNLAEGWRTHERVSGQKKVEVWTFLNTQRPAEVHASSLSFFFFAFNLVIFNFYWMLNIYWVKTLLLKTFKK